MKHPPTGLGKNNCIARTTLESIKALTHWNASLTQFTLCQPSGFGPWLTNQQAYSTLLHPGSALMMLNFLKHHFWRKEKHDILSHYTAPELLLFTGTKFKQVLKTCYFNGSGWREGIFCPTKTQQPMGAKRGAAQPRAGLDKGWIKALFHLV